MAPSGVVCRCRCHSNTLRTGPEGNHDDVAATSWPVRLMGFRLNPDVRVASGTISPHRFPLPLSAMTRDQLEPSEPPDNERLEDIIRPGRLGPLDARPNPSR